MMRRVGVGIGAALWFVFAFWAVYRLTFPSSAVAERLAWEAQERLGLSLKLDTVHPWWLGVGASGVKVGAVDARSGEAQPLLDADSLRLRASFLGLLTGNQRVLGDATMGEGTVSFLVDAAQGDRGLELQVLDVDATAFPISAMPPVGGMAISGRGGLDLSIDLDGSGGMNKADGHFRVSGQEIVIQDVGGMEAVLASFGVLPAELEEIDIDVQFSSGKGRVDAGRIATSLANVEVAGNITMAKRLDRAKCDLTFQIRPAEDLPAQALTFMRAAEQDDGTYKYQLKGLCSRGSFTPIRKTPQRAARPAPRRTTATPVGDKAAAMTGSRPTPPTADLGAPTAVPRTGVAAAERAANMEAIPLEEEDEVLDDEEGLEELEVGEEGEVAPADY